MAAITLTVATCIAAPVGAAHAVGAWQSALQVPGTAGLNAGGNAAIASVSCASAGNCSASGDYLDVSGHYQAFVENEVNGVWQTAVEVPGTAALNAGGDATVGSVSCRSAGNCSAGGDYYDASNNQQAFVVSEVNGVWQTAVEVPGSAALNAGGNAYVNSVSCASVGNCSVAGAYADASHHEQAFEADEVGGVWQTAVEVPGTAALNAGGIAWVRSVSCASVGNCSAGGYYLDAAHHDQGFVVNEVSGTWQTAVEVPGSAALNVGGNAYVNSLSCASAGYCSAVGAYSDAANHHQAFVVNEEGGTWQNAAQIPGTAALNAGGNAYATAVSCPAAGSCSATGSYSDASGHSQAFAVSGALGVWESAVQVPGTAALNAGGNAVAGSVSCSSADNCSAGGSYLDASQHLQAFVVDEVNGTWQNASEVSGTAALNVGGNASVESVSCATDGYCSAGGYYDDASGHEQVFAVWTGWQNAIEVPGIAPLNTGGSAEVYSVSCVAGGNCSAGGYYGDTTLHEHAFVVNEVNGVWQNAEEVPGTAALNVGGVGAVVSVSCSSAGSCSAVGGYNDASGLGQAFVVNEVGGTWQTAVEAPGTAALDAGSDAGLTSVSCPASGSCTAGGYYSYDVNGHTEALVESEVGGTWQNAVRLPGIAALNAGGFASVDQLSCPSAGNCTAVGFYTEASGHAQAFVASEVNGTWQNAVTMPGFVALNTGGYGDAFSVSCPSAAYCSAGGIYKDASGHYQAFVAGEVNGTWQNAVQVPGTATLNVGLEAKTASVSCASAGYCSASGFYKDASGHRQAFVVGESDGRWQAATQVPGTATLNAGDAQAPSVSCSARGYCSVGGFYMDAAGHTQAFLANEVGGRWQNAAEVPGTAALNAGGSAEVNAVSCAAAGNCGAGGFYTDASGLARAFVVSSS